MTYQYSVNNSPATGNIAMYIAMTLLVSAGWTVKSSSDGTTYNSTGNQITSGNSGAGGLANSKAWFRIQAPLFNSQTRELIFQTSSSTNASFRIKYSASAGFIGGSPGAIQTPSATDEVIILGAGTDAAPTFSSQFSTDATYHFHMMAGDSSIGYSFYFFANTGGAQPANALNACFIFDVLQIGSYNSLDTDPCIIYTSQSTSSLGTSLTGAATAKGLLNVSYVGHAAAALYSNSTYIFPASVGNKSVQNPFNTKDELFPIVWIRDPFQTPPFGVKGVSSFMLGSSVIHTSFSYQTVNTKRDRIILGYFSFPWNGNQIVQ
jgi:hypothetical protein